jgi:hypothetical protein
VPAGDETPGLDELEPAGADVEDEAAGPDEAEPGVDDAGAEDEVDKLEDDSMVTVPLLMRVVVMVTCVVETKGVEEPVAVMPPAAVPVSEGLPVVPDPPPVVVGWEMVTEVRVSGQTVVE